MEQSIFTKIINGDVPCHKVYEDENFFGIMDIHPIHDGHVVLISKEQVETVWELSDDSLQKLILATKKIVDALLKVFEPYRVVSRIEGFDVAHAHVNIFPVINAKDIHKKQDTESEPNHKKLATLAEKIKGEIS
jgi:histidine triad (HIT) family protein